MTFASVWCNTNAMHALDIAVRLTYVRMFGMCIEAILAFARIVGHTNGIFAARNANCRTGIAVADNV